jgi:2'-5' RNA ligase
MRRRIFIAAPLPVETANEIIIWCRQKKTEFPLLRWVRKDHLHLTLRFLGDVSEDILNRTRNVIRKDLIPPVCFRLDRTGSFGRSAGRLPSVYWISGKFDTDLIGFADTLASIPDDQGRIVRKSFFPHITIARQGKSGKKAVFGFSDPWEGVLNRVVIYNSTLLPEGPEYEIIDEFILR